MKCTSPPFIHRTTIKVVLRGWGKYHWLHLLMKKLRYKKGKWLTYVSLGNILKARTKIILKELNKQCVFTIILHQQYTDSWIIVASNDSHTSGSYGSFHYLYVLTLSWTSTTASCVYINTCTWMCTKVIKWEDRILPHR